MRSVQIRAREVERLVNSVARVQHGVLSRRQLLAVGIDSRRLRALQRRGTIECMTDGVIRLAGAPETTHQTVMAAVLDAPPGAIASHQTAAFLWNLPGFDLPRETHVTIPRQGAPQRHKLAVIHFQKDLPMSEVVLRHGIPTTTPTMTIFHLGAVLHPARVERAFDHAVVRRLTSGDRLAELTDLIGARGRNGTRLARELARRHEGRPPPESGLENRVDWLGTQAGISLERQVRVGREHLVGRADFRVAGTKGLIEAQSILYHSSPLDSAADQTRIARFLAAGFSVLTIWDYQAFHYPDSVIRAMGEFVRDLRANKHPFHRDCPDPA